MKRVLLVASVYGHFTAFHLPFVKLLQEEFNAEILVAAKPSFNSDARDQLTSLGVRCIDIPISRSVAPWRNIRALKVLVRLMRDGGFDLVHTHTAVASFWCRLSSCIAKGPRVLYTAHGFYFTKESSRLHRLVFESIERLAAPMTAGIIVINEEDFAAASRMGYVPQVSLFRTHGVGVPLHNRVLLEAPKSFRQEYGIPADAVVVTCVAYMRKGKNHSMLLQAWKEVEKEVGNAYLCLVGDGQVRKNLERYVENQGLQNVIFTGVRRDITRLLSESDIATLASRREGLPRFLMEAMVVSKPIVATDVRGSRDLVENGVNGFLVRLGDVSGFADALTRLIRDSHLRNRMGQASREMIQDFDVDKVAEEMRAIYGKFFQSI